MDPAAAAAPQRRLVRVEAAGTTTLACVISRVSDEEAPKHENASRGDKSEPIPKSEPNGTRDMLPRGTTPFPKKCIRRRAHALLLATGSVRPRLSFPSAPLFHTAPRVRERETLPRCFAQRPRVLPDRDLRPEGLQSLDAQRASRRRLDTARKQKNVLVAQRCPRRARRRQASLECLPARARA